MIFRPFVGRTVFVCLRKQSQATRRTTAIKNQDFFLIQAIVFVVALMVVIVNIAIDVSYKALDPRVKLA